MEEASASSETTGRCVVVSSTPQGLNLPSITDLAVAFASRSRSALAVEFLRKWRAVYTSHQNAQAFAVHYHSSQLQYQMLRTWRLQLRAKLKLLKQARVTEKQLVVKRAWRKWQEKSAEKDRQRKLKQFEAGILRKFVHGGCFPCVVR